MPYLDTIAFDVEDGCVVFVSGTDPINDAEWDQYTQFLKDNLQKGGRPRAIAISDVSLTSVQRKKLDAASVQVKYEGRSAVVTSSTIVRGVVTAFSWLGQRMRAFSPADLQSALTYLQLSPATEAAVLEHIGRMRRHFQRTAAKVSA